MSRVTLGARIDAIETLIRIVSPGGQKPTRSELDMLIDRAKQGISVLNLVKGSVEAQALLAAIAIEGRA